MLIFVLIASIAFAILALYTLVILFYTKVPFVRTPNRVIAMVLDEANIKPGENVYDLGCGDARFLIEVEKRTGANTFGFEIAPWAYFLARLNIKLKKSKTVLYHKNFYKQDLSGADVVFCFLMDSVMPKVQAKLEQDLKPGARVISFAFAIKAWQPAKIIDSKKFHPRASKIYIYQR